MLSQLFHTVDYYSKEYIQSLGDNDKTGYILEVDLDVPSEKHDYFRDYPYAYNRWRYRHQLGHHSDHLEAQHEAKQKHLPPAVRRRYRDHIQQAAEEHGLVSVPGDEAWYRNYAKDAPGQYDPYTDRTYYKVPRGPPIRAEVPELPYSKASARRAEILKLEEMHKANPYKMDWKDINRLNRLRAEEAREGSKGKGIGGGNIGGGGGDKHKTEIRDCLLRFRAII